MQNIDSEIYNKKKDIYTPIGKALNIHVLNRHRQ